MSDLTDAYQVGAELSEPSPLSGLQDPRMGRILGSGPHDRVPRIYQTVAEQRADAAFHAEAAAARLRDQANYEAKSAAFGGAAYSGNALAFAPPSRGPMPTPEPSVLPGVLDQALNHLRSTLDTLTQVYGMNVAMADRPLEGAELTTIGYAEAILEYATQIRINAESILRVAGRLA